MQTSFIIVVTTLALVSQIHCLPRPKTVLFGYCYDIKTPNNFDFQQFTAGKWFEISKYDNEFEGTAECIEQTFFLDETKTSIAISYSMRLQNGSQAIQQAAVNYTVGADEVLLGVTYPDNPTIADFDVLATDFQSYSIIYSCRQTTTEGLPMKDERLWVLSRTTQLSTEALAAVEDALIYNGDSLGAYLYPTNQEKCV